MQTTLHRDRSDRRILIAAIGDRDRADRRHGGATWLAALLATAPAFAGEPPPLDAPVDWDLETLPFPLGFAPTPPLRGVEHVRFTPRWRDFAAPDGFSYLFARDIEPVAGTPGQLERWLERYFRGLMRAVGEGMRPRPTHASLALAGATFTGRVDTWNAFSTGEPLTLHVELTVDACAPDHDRRFVLLSRAPPDAAIWDSLREVREPARCGGDG